MAAWTETGQIHRRVFCCFMGPGDCMCILKYGKWNNVRSAHSITKHLHLESDLAIQISSSSRMSKSRRQMKARTFQAMKKELYLKILYVTYKVTSQSKLYLHTRNFLQLRTQRANAIYTGYSTEQNNSCSEKNQTKTKEN